MSLYDNRLVAYVDIIGWSDACRNESANLAEAAAAVIHHAAGNYSSHRKEALKNDPNLLVNPMFLQNEFAAFSDNFVLSLPESFGGRIFFAEHAFWFISAYSGCEVLEKRAIKEADDFLVWMGS